MAGPLPFDAMNNLSILCDKTVLVTGGCGFLGQHLCELLLKCGAIVRVFDLNIKRFSEKIEFIQGNLMNSSEIQNACKGCWAVFHTAAPSPLAGNKNLFYSVNVEGTQNVIQACIKQDVTRLIYTSSASIIYDGTDQQNLDETVKPPLTPFSDYAYSKCLAENEVLNTEKLAVCAIRPHAIFGPRDPHFVPSLVKAGKTGKSRYIVGSGNNRVDFTYVGNVAYAHLLAATKLTLDSPLNKQAYFITNDEVVPFWAFVGEIHEKLGYTKPWIKIPFLLMRFIVFLFSIISFFLPNFKPVFNYQSITYAGRDHFYSCKKANRDFGYVPPISLKEGQKRNLEYFEYLKAEKTINNKNK